VAISDSGVELLVDAKAEIGEGPSWDERESVLHWVDIPNGQVHTYDSKSRVDRVVSVRGYASSVVPYAGDGDRVVVTQQHRISLLDLTTGELSKIADVEGDLRGNRFNDGKCDTRGRLWAGTMNIKQDAPTGALYRFEGVRVKRMVSRVTISNGMGWSPDDSTMYYIDTPTLIVSAFDYDADRGTISRRRKLINFSGQEGKPDGMTVDDEGMLWVAQWGGFRVSRWNPKTGEMIGHLAVPAANVSSCCFGGKELDELYITTARNKTNPALLRRYPKAGGLFRAKPGVRGLPTNRFSLRPGKG
jgi:sugar lactone lactonase YvrE